MLEQHGRNCRVSIDEGAIETEDRNVYRLCRRRPSTFDWKVMSLLTIFQKCLSDEQLLTRCESIVLQQVGVLKRIDGAKLIMRSVMHFRFEGDCAVDHISRISINA